MVSLKTSETKDCMILSGLKNKSKQRYCVWQHTCCTLPLKRSLSLKDEPILFAHQYTWFRMHLLNEQCLRASYADICIPRNYFLGIYSNGKIVGDAVEASHYLEAFEKFRHVYRCNIIVFRTSLVARNRIKQLTCPARYQGRTSIIIRYHAVFICSVITNSLGIPLKHTS